MRLLASGGGGYRNKKEQTHSQGQYNNDTKEEARNWGSSQYLLAETSAGVNGVWSGDWGEALLGEEGGGHIILVFSSWLGFVLLHCNIALLAAIHLITPDRDSKRRNNK